jgi:hypothetical protein
MHAPNQDESAKSVVGAFVVRDSARIMASLKRALKIANSAKQQVARGGLNRCQQRDAQDGLCCNDSM